MNPLELLWDQLLSRQPELVRKAYSELALPEQQAVRLHLEHMINEPGWHPEQRLSAWVAIQALSDSEDA